ncbi:ABC transporter ATP-binding protein [Ammoniphilus sp. CFH 90114]|uniref:ABC transporter ATP-binding protein n=1 Tax=Ammoniphilus sp. CFH 90114 TaxID=2493665 RepID=UPI00100E3C3D|nr:ABC transporter ATP-binding protein [Ammoniphilus sp. CFH 90114]RXT07095.1 ABC transporter ATP-binding protein [Ammoniphilus sp. CFH 90114]
MSIIHVQNVNYRRDGRDILTDISWKMEEGQHWAFIGLNGAGKTTLLKMINGYIWPVAGTEASIEVLGKTFGSVDLRELRKSIGWVSSSLADSLSPSHTVSQLVISGKFATLGIYDEVTEQDEAKAASIMEDMGIQHLTDRPFGVCSQGERQKVLISRALMASPRLLILDEPCTGLDIYSREKLLAAIEKLGVNGPSMIYVTHHIEEVCSVFTHALVIHDGRIIAAGPKEEVISDEILSRGLGLPLEVQWKLGRAWVQLKEGIPL